MKWIVTTILGFINFGLAGLVWAKVASMTFNLRQSRIMNPMDSMRHEYFSPLVGLVAAIAFVILASLIEGRMRGQKWKEILQMTVIITVLSILIISALVDTRS